MFFISVLSDAVPTADLNVRLSKQAEQRLYLGIGV
jgi:hypothetical protein